MLMETFGQMIGQLPTGYEPLGFVVGALSLLYVVDCFYSIVRTLFGRRG